MQIKIAVLWDVMSCIMADRNECFRGTYCLDLHCRRGSGSLWNVPICHTPFIPEHGNLTVHFCKNFSSNTESKSGYCIPHLQFSCTWCTLIEQSINVLQFNDQLPDIIYTIQPSPEHVAWCPAITEYTSERPFQSAGVFQRNGAKHQIFLPADTRYGQLCTEQWNGITDMSCVSCVMGSHICLL